jgi:hypothetical protein
MPGNKWPAVIEEVTVGREAREVRVSIPPFTDGAGVFPLAEIEYPIGDDSTDTEIRMVVGKPVWVQFIAGDHRRPIITGSRNPNTGNEVGTRRWNHDNFEINADVDYTVNAQTITLKAGSKITLVVGGTSITLTSADIVAVASKIKLN